LLERLDKNKFSVKSIQETKKSIKPIAPFTASKLQQAAANKFGFTSRKTMQIAQQLYEGVNLGKERIGLITYMRTDSTRISEQALGEVRNFIGETYPESLPDKPNYYSKSTGAQDAHEAIRPTSTFRSPENLKEFLDKDQYKIYSIIWERFVSSQMVNAESLTQTVHIDNNNVIFKVSKTVTVKPGFNECLNLLKAKDSDKSKKIPKLAEGDKVSLVELLPEQHFTQPPPRYTDASIVKFLEENGIGRPSTYAPTISTLLFRYYAVRRARQIMPTVLGKLVNTIVVEEFPDIVNIDFTANLEKELDLIANGELTNKELLSDFYEPFIKRVEEASENLEDMKKVFDEPTDEICDKCYRPMLKKLGKYGFFIACSGFPECRNSKPIPLADCPREDCNGKIVPKRKAKRGREFYGCSRYPECDFVTWNKPLDCKCPKCGKFLVEKNDKVHGTFRECIDADCGYKQLEEHTCNT